MFFPRLRLLRIRRPAPHETAEAGSLDRRDVGEHIFAASLWLYKSIALLRIEPLHGTYGHYLLLVDLARIIGNRRTGSLLGVSFSTLQ
jgi:hypothetical protein